VAVLEQSCARVNVLAVHYEEGRRFQAQVAPPAERQDGQAGRGKAVLTAGQTSGQSESPARVQPEIQVTDPVFAVAAGRGLAADHLRG
jgi:hypothetical protein